MQLSLPFYIIILFSLVYMNFLAHQVDLLAQFIFSFTQLNSYGPLSCVRNELIHSLIHS